MKQDFVAWNVRRVLLRKRCGFGRREFGH
jgi:hypothetical protein